MKKKILGALAVICTVVCAGCGSGKVKTDDLAKYVKLGNIRDLGVEYVKTEVTDEDIDSAIEEELAGMADLEEKDSPAQRGDVIDIRMTVTSEDGEVLYDFSDDVYDMTIGEGEWGEEFDECLIGRSAGDSAQATFDYDEDFEDMLMCGHTVTFDYTIEKVYNATIPVLDDELLSEMGYESEEAYREYIRESLAEENEYDDRETYIQQLLEAVEQNSEFSDIPKSVLDYTGECVKAGYESYADMMSCDVEEVYSMMGVTDSDIEEESLSYAKELIIIDAIRVSEGIELDSATYDKKLKDFMDEEEYDNMTEVYEDYEKTELEELFMDELVKDYLVSINS